MKVLFSQGKVKDEKGIWEKVKIKKRIKKIKFDGNRLVTSRVSLYDRRITER